MSTQRQSQYDPPNANANRYLGKRTHTLPNAQSSCHTDNPSPSIGSDIPFYVSHTQLAVDWHMPIGGKSDVNPTSIGGPKPPLTKEQVNYRDRPKCLDVGRFRLSISNETPLQRQSFFAALPIQCQSSTNLTIHYQPTEAIP